MLPEFEGRDTAGFSARIARSSARLSAAKPSGLTASCCRRAR